MKSKFYENMLKKYREKSKFLSVPILWHSSSHVRISVILMFATYFISHNTCNHSAYNSTCYKSYYNLPCHFFFLLKFFRRCKPPNSFFPFKGFAKSFAFKLYHKFIDFSMFCVVLALISIC